MPRQAATAPEDCARRWRLIRAIPLLVEACRAQESVSASVFLDEGHYRSLHAHFHSFQFTQHVPRGVGNWAKAASCGLIFPGLAQRMRSEGKAGDAMECWLAFEHGLARPGSLLALTPLGDVLEGDSLSAPGSCSPTPPVTAGKIVLSIGVGHTLGHARGTFRCFLSRTCRC